MELSLIHHFLRCWLPTDHWKARSQHIAWQLQIAANNDPLWRSFLQSHVGQFHSYRSNSTLTGFLFILNPTDNAVIIE